MQVNRISDYWLIGLLLFAGFGLISGLFAGLVRLGWDITGGSPVPPLAHGPLMINGFLGTLIGLERSAALEKKWAYLAPVSLAAATVLLLSGYTFIGVWLQAAGSMVLFLVLAYLYRLQAELYHLIMALGGVSLLIGNIMYLLGYPIYSLVAWWAGFPLLTIFGERLELNRIMRPPRSAQNIFGGLTFVWILGVAMMYLDRYMGWFIASASLIGLALWLLKYDVARRTIKASEWTRYSAVCLLTGYGWLILAGLLSLWKGFPSAGPIYDALLHMIFVGFVFSMIFAHAAVIIPSLSGRLIPYHKYFYLPLILLHLSLLMRVAGDLFWNPFIRKSGAHTNVLAILLFIGGIIYQLNRKSKAKQTV